MTKLWKPAPALLAALALAGCMEFEESAPKPRLEPTGTAGGDFGQTLPHTRKQLQFKLTNSGAGFPKVQTMTDIQIALAVTSAGLSLGPRACPTSLEEEEFCLITVDYAPVAPGTLVNQIIVTSNAETVSVALSGSAVGALDPAAGALNFSDDTDGAFGPVAVGGSKSKPYTLRNAGNAADAITISGPSGDGWTVADDCPDTLPQDATCVITVTFAPTARGDSAPAPLVITDAYNRDYGGLSVKLSASGD